MEVHQHYWRGACERGQRHGHERCRLVRQSEAAWHRVELVGKRYKTEDGCHRQLEADREQPVRIDGKNYEHCYTERVERVGVALAYFRAEIYAYHHCRADNRGHKAREQGVEPHYGYHNKMPVAARARPQAQWEKQQGGNGGEQSRMEAAYAQQVRQPRGAEALAHGGSGILVAESGRHQQARCGRRQRGRVDGIGYGAAKILQAGHH